MRIGLFTDSYRPSVNGIVYVVESLKRELEALGHEVFVFCPANTIRTKNIDYQDEPNIIRFPSLSNAFFDDFNVSLFFPPRVVRQINELNLDVAHIFTPSQVGLVGIQSSVKNGIPFVIQHCTDLYEFSADYPAVLPGVLILITVLFPTTGTLARKDIPQIIKLYKPYRRAADWNQNIIKRAITILYSKADAVIALSDKSAEQLKSWQDDDYNYNLTILPNGVDALPEPSAAQLADFKKQFNILPQDEIFGFVGRLGKEKNLDILIPTLDYVIQKRPNAKLMFVGDFEYRQTLEEIAAQSDYSDHIIFTGALPRQDLGVAYKSMKVFVFPSLKDTQGWVLHEAAHAGLPIVLLDRKVSRVVEDGQNGFYADNNPEDLSDKIIEILEDQSTYSRMSARSKQLAADLTEASQVKKLEKLYSDLIK